MVKFSGLVNLRREATHSGFKDEKIPKSTLGTWLKFKEKVMEAGSKGKVNVKRDMQACNQRVDEAL